MMRMLLLCFFLLPAPQREQPPPFQFYKDSNGIYQMVIP